MNRPDRTLYGRRKGKPLRTYQAALVSDFLPRVVIPIDGMIDPAKLYATPLRALRLEIGFGGGEHLARQAADNPDVGFIGCEPFVNGVAKLLARIEVDALTNIRVHVGDARDVLACLPDACLDRIDLLYPDPWPKRRQRKRRFVSLESLEQLARCLMPGGILRFASDIDDYTGWTLAHVLEAQTFRWEPVHARDWQNPWPDWQATRYEQKARGEGRDSAYLTFTRR